MSVKKALVVDVFAWLCVSLRTALMRLQKEVVHVDNIAPNGLLEQRCKRCFARGAPSVDSNQHRLMLWQEGVYLLKDRLYNRLHEKSSFPEGSFPLF